MKVPRRWSSKFAIATGNDVQHLIQYDKVYVFQSHQTGDFFVQRFWPNGRMCKWIRHDMGSFDPDRIDQNTYPGRFLIEGDVITVETVGVDEGGARFLLEYGTVQSTGEIVYERANPRSDPDRVRLEFKPEYVGPMSASASW